jgi:REP element-mobilizing transposase RayT
VNSLTKWALAQNDMPMVKAYIHFIWATKKRQPLITPELKPQLLQHIKENSFKKEIFIDRLNCTDDHIHLLISLGTEQTIAKTAMLIKGESAWWVNKQGLTRIKFEWQDEYIAVSVNYLNVDMVRRYIENQEEHHKKKTFTGEYEEFLQENGFHDILAKANS